jgi:AmmeMemoRadiSam system protein B/AmmeMemoRadiSam system protein A
MNALRRVSGAVTICLVMVSGSCVPQDERVDRQPVVAGQFYPSDPSELRQMLTQLFSRATPSRHYQNVVAIIAPHAAYVFSGEVAASSFNQVDGGKTYDHVFLLAPSHYVGFEGGSIYTRGDYVTPLGEVTVDRELARKLVGENAVLVDRMDAHAREHSLEVELPFLQQVMKKPVKIIPIIVGAQEVSTCRKIAEALRPYFTTRNLFIVSTDFSHYPSYDDARSVDRATADAVCSNSPDRFMEVLRANEQKGVPGLVTSMCGWACVLTLEYLTEGNAAVTYHDVQYKNSGDAGLGGKDRVVGYHAIAVTLDQPQEKSGFNLTPGEKDELLKIARATVEEYVRHQQIPTVDPAKLSASLKTPCGAFVTLQKNNQLRGCIGRFDPGDPLYSVVQQMAVASATQDYRFPPVTEGELGNLQIEISVLTPMRKINSIDEIELGKHGIYIRKGARAGTYLPQVATETGWTKEEFLGHCAQEKAGIGWDGWKDADIFVYEALVFGEKE